MRPPNTVSPKSALSEITYGVGLHLKGSETSYMFEDFKEGGKPIREISIGRDTDCHIAFEKDRSVSRQHAVIERVDGGRYTITNQSEKNGIYIHGQAITEPTLLIAGMRIRIGGKRFKVMNIYREVPILVSSRGELCYRFGEWFGNYSAAERHTDMKHNSMREFANKWKRKRLYGHD